MGVGDCVFWSIICLVGVTFLWLKYIDPFLSIWYSWIPSGAIIFFIFYRWFKLRKSGEKKNG